MWRLDVLCAFDVPLCGGTAFDVRAGLFSGSGLADKSMEGNLLLTYIDEQLLPRDF
jgi:hypothetical protein